MPAALPPSAVQQFIVDGFHVVKPSDLTTLTPAFHRAVIDQADAAIAARDKTIEQRDATIEKRDATIAALYDKMAS